MSFFDPVLRLLALPYRVGRNEADIRDLQARVHELEVAFAKANGQLDGRLGTIDRQIQNYRQNLCKSIDDRAAIQEQTDDLRRELKRIDDELDLVLKVIREERDKIDGLDGDDLSRDGVKHRLNQWSSRVAGKRRKVNTELGRLDECKVTD